MVACTILALIVSGKIQPWHAYIGIFITGTGWTLDFVARRSLYSELFPSSGLVNAISLDTASMTGTMMIGPILGGSLISLAGFAGAYWAMIAMFLIALLLVLAISDKGSGKSNVAMGSMFSQVKEALRTIRSNRTIWAAFLVTVFLNFFGFPYMQMVPVIARDVLGGGGGALRRSDVRSGNGSTDGIPAHRLPTRPPQGSGVYLRSRAYASSLVLLRPLTTLLALSDFALRGGVGHGRIRHHAGGHCPGSGASRDAGTGYGSHSPGHRSESPGDAGSRPNGGGLGCSHSPGPSDWQRFLCNDVAMVALTGARGRTE